VQITVTNTNGSFRYAAGSTAVLVGGVLCTGVIIDSTTQLRATTPANTLTYPYAQQVVVSTPGGVSVDPVYYYASGWWYPYISSLELLVVAGYGESSSGGNITSMADLTGHGHTASVTSGALATASVDSGYNGNKVITTGGGYMTGSASLPTPLTVIMCGELSANGGFFQFSRVGLLSYGIYRYGPSTAYLNYNGKEYGFSATLSAKHVQTASMAVPSGKTAINSITLTERGADYPDGGAAATSFRIGETAGLSSPAGKLACVAVSLTETPPSGLVSAVGSNYNVTIP
jgi:hypothetical protein